MDKRRKGAGLIALLLMLIASAFLLGSHVMQQKKEEKKDYGVFLNVDDSVLDQLGVYETVVIDAQYFKEKDIEMLHENGTIVYTYLNIGSIETFREYYKTYADLAIGDYENWEEEKWVNVADKDWQEFMDTLAGKLKKKGVDGFFIDNCDVYDYAHKKDIFDGLTVILKKIRAMGKPVVVNGGDIYVTAYQSRYGSAADIMTGVNQESVWSRIDFTTKTFHTQKKTEREYFCQYLQACKADGMEVYLLEYTTDHKLIRRIKKYCRKKKYDYYIADSLELGI